jgi:hypothetical protein
LRMGILSGANADIHNGDHADTPAEH